MEKDIEYKVVELLIKKGFHITFAESCTAGLAAGRLVNVPDASKVLDVSFVTYANEAKVKYVGVDEETIERCGVVSEEVAGQMARGAAEAMGAEVGVGISGIAGPTGGTAEKPVGMVCFGICIDGEVSTYTKQFGNIGRNEVRACSVDFIYEKLAELLK
ncbi:MAG: CinA family protein [Eubacterium sp.]|nr:CinA family protein [Eubacterium sp.]